MAALFSGSSETEKGRIAVTLTLASGTTHNGHVFVKTAGQLRDLLNGPDRFLEFEKRDQSLVYLSKDNILTVAALAVPKNDQLQRRARDLHAFDPYHSLGIDRTAGAGEIRAAYWRRARDYHPDKLAGIGAPKEVLDYMNAMFARIHAAYKELSGETEPGQPQDHSAASR
jgi:hypothetical protein